MTGGALSASANGGGGIVGGGLIAQGGQALIHFRQFSASLQGEFALFEQLRDLVKAFCPDLLPFAGLLPQAFQPFG